MGTGKFPSQRPVTRSFDVFPNLRQTKWDWWFETPSRPLWHHCNDSIYYGMCATMAWKAKDTGCSTNGLTVLLRVKIIDMLWRYCTSGLRWQMFEILQNYFIIIRTWTIKSTRNFVNDIFTCLLSILLFVHVSHDDDLKISEQLCTFRSHRKRCGMKSWFTSVKRQESHIYL